METIAKIRRRHLIQGDSISSIVRDFNLSRNTVRKYLQTEQHEPQYQRSHQPKPKLGEYESILEDWLIRDSYLPKQQRRTARRLFECLQTEGYQGAYDSVQRYVGIWKKSSLRPKSKQVFVPMLFLPGDTCQFDWSYETVELSGEIHKVKVAHFRLAHSRKCFVVAYPRETQEMVMDAHQRAFRFFDGVLKRMVYNNLKTVVDTIMTGKERQFNRRFMALAAHYLFEPVACTPASGWEKGQIENQVGNIREWLFTPCPKFNDLQEPNHWLELWCQELAVREHGLEPLQVACELTLQYGAFHPSIVINELRRLISPAPPANLDLSEQERWQLHHEPQANINRYDSLLGG